MMSVEFRQFRQPSFHQLLAARAAEMALLIIMPGAALAFPQPTQQSQLDNAPPREFDAASIKLVDRDSGADHYHENNDPGRVSMVTSAHQLIVRAYGIADQQLGGEPSWFRDRLYRIDAVTGRMVSNGEMLSMLRGLLADRFQLKLREDQRDVPVYALELPPGGPKFKELQAGAKAPRLDPPPEGFFRRRFSTVAQLVSLLNHANGGVFSLDRPVVDSTGLIGQYDIVLLTAMETKTDDQGRRSVQFPDLFHDLQSQLGLKVTKKALRMPFFVVEHSGTPSEN